MDQTIKHTSVVLFQGKLPFEMQLRHTYPTAAYNVVQELKAMSSSADLVTLFLV